MIFAVLILLLVLVVLFTAMQTLYLEKAYVAAHALISSHAALQEPKSSRASVCAPKKER